MSFTRIALPLFVLVLLAPAAPADQGAIDYRQAVYKALGGHMSAIAGILRREVPYGADLGVHARGVAALAPLTLHLFPPGSDVGRTNALPRVWEDPLTFAERRERFIAAATAFGATDPADQQAYRAAFGAVGEACRACHDDFKAD